jgi:hypothetical protein
MILSFGVWCAMSATRIIVVIFSFETTLTFFEHLSYSRRICTIFCQQDIVTPGTILCVVCRVYVQGFYPPCLPDQKLCDFWFWDMLKADVYSNNTCIEDSVKKYKGYILIYIRQDATLHSLFYLETAPHVSGGTIARHQECKQLSTASGICHTIMDRVKFTDKEYR